MLSRETEECNYPLIITLGFHNSELTDSSAQGLKSPNPIVR
ncbi:MAG: hypothetical protein ACI9FU_001693 [Granulosicoccus sp.]|jgi:hypothetical protein